MENNGPWRRTAQFLMPAQKPVPFGDTYDIYPAAHLAPGMIYAGFKSLAEALPARGNVLIDGFGGVFFEDFREELNQQLAGAGVAAAWHPLASALRTPEDIALRIAPFLGGDDPVFGKRTHLSLLDFFDPDRLNSLNPDPEFPLNIFYGTGAFLTGLQGFRIYLDVPKNEIQFRSRAGSITNLGAREPSDPKSMYKRFYFVDWVVLNSYKEEMLPSVHLFADVQRPAEPVWMKGEDYRTALSGISRDAFRVRPWFEPGTWGGNWIKKQIPGLNLDVPNYAWSFELIVPENGLLLESDGLLMETTFESLMFLEGRNVLGVDHDRFGAEFPIRFDFLDTVGGGNLSVQCHPRLSYMQEHFGESITQEETYYILDTTGDGDVYLGFQENIDPEEFRHTLENSFQYAEPVDIERFVQKHRAKRHDLFLIPPGTIHASGNGNLVLEISSTPYIYTFKMYDWLRPDLDGKPRPLNIGRGMDNLDFSRKGAAVIEQLISKPVLTAKGDHWTIFSLPTHPDHLYSVERIHFSGSISLETSGKCHVLSLVEGKRIKVTTRNGVDHVFHFAETFVISAAAGSYEVTAEDGSEVRLIRAFVK
jgi:mannose-6-phosphate isomerase class I